MQKLTTTELRLIVREMENAAENFVEMSAKTDNSDAQAFLKLNAENLYSVAKKIRIAIDNEDKRIAIL